MLKQTFTQSLCLLLLSIGLGSPRTSLADEFDSIAGGFRVDAPWKIQESLVLGPGGSLVLQSVARGDKADAIVVSVENFTSKRFQSVGAETFFAGTEESFKAAMPQSDMTKEAIVHRRLNGQEFRLAVSEDAEFRIRVFFRNRIGYKLVAAGSKAFVNSAEVTTFFNSFQLLWSEDQSLKDFVMNADKLPSNFVALTAPSSNFQAIMLPQATGLITKAAANSNDVMEYVGANGDKQFYIILNREVAGITVEDSSRIDKFTKQAIDMASDGTGAGYRQTSVRNLKQSGIAITEHEYRNDNENRYLKLRRMVQQDRIYWWMVGWKQGRGDSGLATKFLDGFQLIKK